MVGPDTACPDCKTEAEAASEKLMQDLITTMRGFDRQIERLEAVDRWAKGGILEFTKEEEALLSFAAPNLLSVLMREPPKEIEETRRRARQELSILLRRPR
jgi:hypothetical protein